MGFLAPVALGLAVLLPIIIAMYLLKLRRTEQDVASLYLWQRMVQDIEANAPWQKLKSNLLLLLQLLIVAALILALARPFTWGEGSTGDLLILVIDSSASMQATDLAPSRLGAAREEAQQILNSISPSTRVTIIEAGERAELRLAGSLDRAAMNQALNQIQGGLGGADLVTALELASAAAAGRVNTDVVVISDGSTQLESADTRYAGVRFVQVGEGDNNQAIALFTLDRQPAGDHTAFVRVVNYADEPVARRLTLWAGERLINAFDIDLEPGGESSVIAEGIETGLLEARLMGEDALPLDDHAWAVAGNERTLQIALVGAGNLFLEAALTLMPGVEFTRIAPEDYDLSVDEMTPVDVVVFDGVVPPELPSSAMLFVGPSGSSSYFEVGVDIDGPRPRVVDPDHPVLSYVDIGEVEILDSPSLELPARARVLVTGEYEGGSMPLLAVFEQDDLRAAVIGFDLRRSDLPLHTAFPILMANLISWLSPGGFGGLPDQVQAGEVVTYSPPADSQSVSLLRPDGSRIELDVVDGEVRIEETDMLGPYSLETYSGTTEHFVVNLFSPEESNIRPSGNVEASTQGTGSAAPDSQLSRLEWWPWFAGAALVVLMVEWLVYQRAAVARVISWLRQRMRGE